MKLLVALIVVAVLGLGCEKSQQPFPKERSPSEIVTLEPPSPPLRPAKEEEPTEPVAETPLKLASKLKPEEHITSTDKPIIDREAATQGNWNMATRGNTEQIKQLLVEGMQVDLPDKEGMTALYRAAHNDKKETVSLLLENGANVNIKDKWGNTPMDVTLNDDIADLLRKHGGKTGVELKAEEK